MVTLGEYVDIVTGFPFKSKNYSSNPDDIPLIRGYNIVQGKLRYDDMKRWSVEEYPDFERYQLSSGDVVLAMDRPWIEAGLKYAVIRDEDCPCLLVQRVARLRGKKELMTEFIRYIVGQDSFAQYLKAIVTGVNVPHISATQIGSYKFALPPEIVQKIIVAILSTYDDLIENNRRRIQLLEEMARVLYREWFVHFRFPGYEDVEMVNSELGEIPEGWKIRKLSEMVSTQYGYTESANEEEIGPKYLRGMDINKTSYISWDDVPYCPIEEKDYEKYRLRTNDILIIRMADPGKVGIIEKEIDSVFASYLIRLNIKNSSLTPYFLFYTLFAERYQNFISGASTGTTRKSASAPLITNYGVVVPTREVMEKFEITVGCMRQQLNFLLYQNSILNKIRNLLLPKLVSGKIDVSDPRIEVPTDNHQTSK